MGRGVYVGVGFGVDVGLGVGVCVGLRVGIDVTTSDTLVSLCSGNTVGVSLIVPIPISKGESVVAAFSSFNLASTVASTARSWTSLASTVALISGVGSNVAEILMSGVGSAGTGVTVEHASTRVPIRTARTTVSFIALTP